MSDLQTLIAEANALDLFRPHGAFEVHCGHCQARLDTLGDCASCGLIGRPAAQLEKRAQTDPGAVTKLLASAIEKRRAFKPAGGKAAR